MTEDIGYYVELARGAVGPVVELGVGTGRIAIPVAEAGVPVIGVDDSTAMLEICRQRANEAGVASLIDLRVGDLRSPPIEERVGLVMVPFRAYLHLLDDRERLQALQAARDLLLPGGWPRSTCSRPAARTSTRRTGSGSSAKPGIGSAPTGTLPSGHSRFESAAMRVRRQCGPGLALTTRVAQADRARRPRARGGLRLVRPPGLQRRRGLHLDHGCRRTAGGDGRPLRVRFRPFASIRRPPSRPARTARISARIAQRGLGRRFCADVESGRAGDPLDVVIGDAGFQQASARRFSGLRREPSAPT